MVWIGLKPQESLWGHHHDILISFITSIWCHPIVMAHRLKNITIEPTKWMGHNKAQLMMEY